MTGFVCRTRRTVFSLFACMLLWLPMSVAWAGAFEDYFEAVKRNDARAVQSLLQRGFDPNAAEEQRGDTGMILALRHDSMDVFRVLLGARGTDLEMKIRNGDNALMIAAYRRNKAAVEALVAKGAQINRPGWTALHYAAAAGSNEIVSFLLERHAYIDAESPNRTTPLMMAAWGGHILTVKLLLEEGADAALRNDVGMDVVDFAKKGGFPDIVDGLNYRLGRKR